MSCRCGSECPWARFVCGSRGRNGSHRLTHSRLESKRATHVNTPRPRQKRILSSLVQGDLIWEVPEESYYTQYNEGAGGSRLLRLGELLEMQEGGWIRRVSQGPQRLDHWEITDEGREVIAPAANKRGRTKQHRQVVE